MSRRGIALLSIAGIMGVVAISLTFKGLWGRSALEAAPSCPEPARIGDTDHCRALLAGEITHLAHRSVRSYDTTTVTVRLDRDPSVTVTGTFEPDRLGAVQTGTRVVADIFRGQMVRLRIGDRWAETTNHPQATVRAMGHCALGAAALAAVVLLLVWIYHRKSRRSA